MNGQDMHRLRFYQEELFDTKNKLFRAKSVKQLKFLQDRIIFLQERIEEIQGNVPERN
jgi:cob(I)alamin adenosyltransferase